MPTTDLRARLRKSSLGRAYRALTDNRAVYRLEAGIAARAQATFDTDSTTLFRKKHVLIAAPGHGNIGDQAMFEAFAANVPGPLTVVVRETADLLHIPVRTPAIEVLPIKGLIYGGTLTYGRDLRKFLACLSDASDVSIIGADVMDGAYRDRASVRRFQIAELVASVGIPSRVIGFSWNAAPTRGSKSAMRSASAMADLVARDSKSAERLRADGATRVRESSDIAFLTKPADSLPRELDEWLGTQATAARPVVVINANYLLESRIDQVASYSRLIQENLDDAAFVLLPHDSRNLPSDETLASAIFEAIPRSPQVLLVPRVLPPGQVALLAERAAFVVSGRMHLTIISATVHTPALSVSYQGKVEGLYRKFGFSSWIDPDSDFDGSLHREFTRMLSHLPERRQQLRSSVPRVKEEALENIIGLAPVLTPSSEV